MSESAQLNRILFWALKNSDLEVVQKTLELDFLMHPKSLILIVKKWPNDQQLSQTALQHLDPLVMIMHLNDRLRPKKCSKMYIQYRAQLRMSFYRVVANTPLVQFRGWHRRFWHSISYEAISFAIEAGNVEISQHYLIDRRGRFLLRPLTDLTKWDLILRVGKSKHCEVFRRQLLQL